YNLRSLKGAISGAAPLPTEVQRQFQALTGARLVEGYGLTEASPVTHCVPLSAEHSPGTIGVPLPSTDAAIFDQETGTRRLGPGGQGIHCPARRPDGQRAGDPRLLPRPHGSLQGAEVRRVPARAAQDAGRQSPAPRADQRRSRAPGDATRELAARVRVRYAD